MKNIGIRLSLLASLMLSGCLPRPAAPDLSKHSDDSNSGTDPDPSVVGGGDAPGALSNNDDPLGGGSDPLSTGGTSGGSGTGEAGGGGGGGEGAGGIKAPAVQSSPRFDEVTWLTSHNAFVNKADEAGWLVENQSRSLQYQLDNGVTAFMLDIHVDGGQAVLCHGMCSGFPSSLYKKMDLIAYLNRIGDYLNKHPEAILTVIFEDYTGINELRAALDKAPSFRDKIYDPYKSDVRNKGWPRLDAMIKANKRLLVISDRSDKKDLGIAYAQDFTVENYWSLGKDGKDVVCKTRWDNVPLNRTDGKFAYLFVMNHFRDIPASALSAADNKINVLWDRINTQCSPAAEKKANFFAVDHFDEADWGARKLVSELNERVAILYADNDLRGKMQMLKAGKYLTKDLSIGDNQLNSIKVSAKTRVKLYADDNFKNLLIELTEDSKNLGDRADKASSIIVESE